VPSASIVELHARFTGSHVFVQQPFDGPHGFVTPAQTPPVQVSLVVQKFESSHGEPSPCAVGVHVPVRHAHPWHSPGEHPVHGELSGRAMTLQLPAMHTPGEHGSPVALSQAVMSATGVAMQPVPETQVPVVQALSRKLQSVG
jgi:hypothetical protein